MKLDNGTTYIYSLIAEGEHVRQDFKFEISDARKIAKTLSAFANTQGGRLLVGVKDNGRIAGISSEEEVYMIDAAATLYCRPTVSYTTENYRVEGRTVLLVEIPESEEKPVYALDEEGKPWAYLRVADENILATPVHLRIWQQSGDGRGELLAFTEHERLLLQHLQAEGCLTLNRCCRLARLPRYTTERLLARLIRYDIVEPVFENHRFTFRLMASHSHEPLV